MEYTVVNAKSLEELVEKVNVHIRDGWRPQGGAFVNHVYPSHSQAMVRDKETSKRDEAEQLDLKPSTRFEAHQIMTTTLPHYLAPRTLACDASQCYLDFVRSDSLPVFSPRKRLVAQNVILRRF